MKTKGFTLIEMLIVVVIIGILASMIVPRILGNAASAKQNACKDNIITINRVFELLAFERSYDITYLDGDFPTTGNADTAFIAPWGTAQVTVVDMKKYFPDGGIKCPVNESKYVIIDGRVNVNDNSFPHSH